MSHDHFIAVTYLKHFGDPADGRRLHAYRKSDGKQFDAFPETVCREWEGDQNPEILKGAPPKILGEYRKIFEPSWNPLVADLAAAKIIDATTKLLLSGYIANLMTCTPAWRRVGASMVEQIIKRQWSRAKQTKLKHGGLPELPVDAIEAVEQGRITMTANPGWIKTMTTMQVMEQALHLYTQPWEILHNQTDEPFLTSDNPVALDPITTPGVSHRVVAITPSIAVHIPIRPDRLVKFGSLKPSDLFRTQPMGVTEHRKIIRVREVKSINLAIVRCAEELVFSAKRSVIIAALVEKYKDHRVLARVEEFMQAGKPRIGYVIDIGVATGPA